MIGLVKTLIPYGIVVMQAGALILLIGLVFARTSSPVRWAGRNALSLSFLITIGTALGSVFYSYILGYEPCILCWWQRIFMFPQFIVFFLAFRKKDNSVFYYTTPLSIFGGLVAIYQILLPYLEKAGITCVSANGVSCTKLYVLEFGYVTIPVMSLTVFVTLILLAVSNKLLYAKQ